MTGQEEASMTPTQALAKTLHATAPHGQLHSFDACPQRHYDRREAEEIVAHLRGQGFSIEEVTA